MYISILCLNVSSNFTELYIRTLRKKLYWLIDEIQDLLKLEKSRGNSVWYPHFATYLETITRINEQATIVSVCVFRIERVMDNTYNQFDVQNSKLYAQLKLQLIMSINEWWWTQCWKTNRIIITPKKKTAASTLTDTDIGISFIHFDERNERFIITIPYHNKRHRYPESNQSNNSILYWNSIC